MRIPGPHAQQDPQRLDRHIGGQLWLGDEIEDYRPASNAIEHIQTERWLFHWAGDSLRLL